MYNIVKNELVNRISSVQWVEHRPGKTDFFCIVFPLVFINIFKMTYNTIFSEFDYYFLGVDC